MKAWRVYGVGDMRLDEIPRPIVKPGWVLRKTRMVQPSITECQALQGVSHFDLESLGEKGPLQMFGHEFCAEVIEVGEGVREPEEWRSCLPNQDCSSLSRMRIMPGGI